MRDERCFSMMKGKKTGKLDKSEAKMKEEFTESGLCILNG